MWAINNDLKYLNQSCKYNQNNIIFQCLCIKYTTYIAIDMHGSLWLMYSLMSDIKCKTVKLQKPKYLKIAMFGIRMVLSKANIQSKIFSKSNTMLPSRDNKISSYQFTI